MWVKQERKGIYTMKKTIFLTGSLLLLTACGGNQTAENITETTATVTTEESKKLPYDLAEMNAKISDYFNESVLFNQQGHDGYEWTVFVKEIELQESEAFHVTITDEFKLLSNEDKTLILQNVHNAARVPIFLQTEKQRNHYIAAYDSNGEKVANSKMTNVLEYEFK